MSDRMYDAGAARTTARSGTRTVSGVEWMLVALAAVVIAGSYLFLSVAESPGLVDGAREWKPNSPLRALVQVLCLNYQQPTIEDDSVKGLIFGVGAGLALVVAGLGWMASRGGPRWDDYEEWEWWDEEAERIRARMAPVRPGGPAPDAPEGIAPTSGEIVPSWSTEKWDDSMPEGLDEDETPLPPAVQGTAESPAEAEEESAAEFEEEQPAHGALVVAPNEMESAAEELDDLNAAEQAPERSAPSASLPEAPKAFDPARSQVGPLTAAQFLGVLFALWGLASLTWVEPTARSLALGGAILIAIRLSWALVLGNGLSRAAGRILVQALWCVGGIVAVVAIWYYLVRNPELRAKFPFGNPLFLAACLMPGLFAGASTALSFGVRYGRDHRFPDLIRCLSALAATALMGAAFGLTGSRGALAGLFFGGVAAAYFYLPRDLKWLTWAGMAAGVLGIIFYLPMQISGSSEHGRDATARVRVYAWSYALELFSEKPWTGYGVGGYVRLADARAAKVPEQSVDPRSDVERDPRALSDRIEHAHNEWLETLSDLGSVGFALLVGMVVLTIWAAARAAEHESDLVRRSAIVGLLGALVALSVEECAGIGLRLYATPVAFFTVVGLLWSLSSVLPGDAPRRLMAWPLLRIPGGVLLVLLGAAWIGTSKWEFQNARRDFELAKRVGEGDFRGALEVAEGGYRLIVERALRTQFRECEALVYAASEVQMRFADRLSRAAKTDSPDANLLAQADADRAECEGLLRRASARLNALVQRAPDYQGAGMLQFLIYRVRYNFAAQSLDRELSLQTARAAMDALEHELRRRPYHLDLALDYVAAGPLTSPEESAKALARRIVILAKPLRYSIPSDRFSQVMLQLASEEGFESVFGDLYVRAQKATVEEAADPENPVARFAPEILRLAGMLKGSLAQRSFSISDYQEARFALGEAAQTYQTFGLVEEARLGMAVCLSDLSIATFLADPEHPQPALEIIGDAIDSAAPGGEEGRRFKDQQFAGPLPLMMLADGQEQNVGNMFMELYTPDPDEVRAMLSDRYCELCRWVSRRPPETLPSGFERWIRRAIELDPGNSDGHVLAALWALQDQDVAAFEQSFAALRKIEVALDDLERLLAQAIVRIPDNDRLLALWREIAPDKPPPTPLAAPPDAGEQAPADGAAPETGSPPATGGGATEPGHEASAGSGRPGAGGEKPKSAGGGTGGG